SVGTNLSTQVDDTLVDHNSTHALFGFFTFNGWHFFESLFVLLGHDNKIEIGDNVYIANVLQITGSIPFP
ncbi:MAG: hypothetical protein ACJAV1_003494, partial [Paraglaciecola sp.]